MSVLFAVGLTVLAANRLAEPPSPNVTSAPSAPSAPSCASVAAAIPLRERLAQRLMVGVNPADPAGAVAVVGAERVGAVFVGGNATQILRTGALTRLQVPGGHPVAVAVDDEGGRVQRIDGLAGSIPSARVMAATLRPEQVRKLAADRGRALRAAGVTVDFAPVADVSSQPARAVIGDRSFSPDPDRVASYAGAFAAGLREAGVLPVFKHFPGHGRANGDSHRGKVSTPALATLRTADLRPYPTLLAAGPAAVMVGHLDVPGLTGGEPATLSPAAYRLLRTEVGFAGLVITDDLGAMRAISDRYELPDAVLGALRAGADIALWTSSKQLGQVLDRLVAAAGAGELPGLDDAVGRVLATKGVTCTP